MHSFLSDLWLAVLSSCLDFIAVMDYNCYYQPPYIFHKVLSVRAFYHSNRYGDRVSIFFFNVCIFPYHPWLLQLDLAVSFYLVTINTISKQLICLFYCWWTAEFFFTIVHASFSIHAWEVFNFSYIILEKNKSKKDHVIYKQERFDFFVICAFKLFILPYCSPSDIEHWAK